MKKAEYKKLIKETLNTKERAKDADLIALPEDMEGTNCKNCHFWKNTDDPDIGYCDHAQVSLFVTDRQTCVQWIAKGMRRLWDHTVVKASELPDYKDQPPLVPSDLEFDALEGLIYTDPAELARAKSVDLMTIPGNIKGTNCQNCVYSTPLHWCKNDKVEQPVKETYCCAYWRNPKTIRPDWDGLSFVQEAEKEERAKQITAAPRSNLGPQPDEDKGSGVEYRPTGRENTEQQKLEGEILAKKPKKKKLFPDKGVA